MFENGNLPPRKINIPLVFQLEKCDNTHALFLLVRDVSVMDSTSGGVVADTVSEFFWQLPRWAGLRRNGVQMKIYSKIRFSQKVILLGMAFCGAGLIASDASVYIRRGLIAQYDGIDNAGLGNHDNSATSWADLSGHGYHAAKHSNPNIVWFDKGWTYLNASLVNGVAPFVLPDNSLINDAVNSKTFSMEVAVSPAAYPNNQICYVYFGNYDNSAKGITFEQILKNGQKYPEAYLENNPCVCATCPVDFGDSFSVAFTSTSRSHIFYKDGVFNSENTVEDKKSNRTVGFAIGGDRKTNRDFTYRGSFYAMRFYNCKLTADEVKINAALDAVRFWGKSLDEANAAMPTGWSLVEGPYLQCSRSGDFTYDGNGNLIEEDRQVLTGTTQTLTILSAAEGTMPMPIVLKAGLAVAGNLKIAVPSIIDNGVYTLIDATGEAGIELSDGATIALADGCGEVAGRIRRLIVEDDQVKLEVSSPANMVEIDDGRIHEYNAPVSADDVSVFRLVDGTLWTSAANVIPGNIGIVFAGGSYAPFGSKFTDPLDGLTGNLSFPVDYPIGLSAISNDLVVVAGDDENRVIALGGNLPSGLRLNDLGADHRLTVSNAVSFAGTGEVEVRSDASGADVVFAKKLSSTGDFNKTGAGTLQLRQGQSAQVVTIRAGTLVYGGDGTETSTVKEIRSGVTDGDAARVSITSGKLTLSGSMTATYAGTIDQSAGEVAIGDTLYVGYEGTGGAYNFTGGKMTVPSKTFAVNVGNKAGSSGVLNISGNVELYDKGNMQVGLYGNGVLNQSGGTVTVEGWPAIGRYPGAVGVYNLSGGSIVQTKANCGFIVGEEGIGTMNISGTGWVETAGPFLIGHASTAVGEVNVFDGGKIIAPSVGIQKPSKSSRLYVDGGTIAAKGSGRVLADFLTVPLMVVGPRGMTLDTGDNTVSVGGPFLGLAGSGPVIKTGTGTLNMPAASRMPVQVRQGVLQASDGALPTTYNGYLGKSALLHRWSFNGDTRDSVGGTSGTLEGAASWNDATNPTAIKLAGGSYGSSSVNLGTGMLPTDGGAVTIEVWASMQTAQYYSRVFNFSTAVANQFTITWCDGTDATKVVPYIMKGGTGVLNPRADIGRSLVGLRIHLAMTVEPQTDGKSKVTWIWRDLGTGVVMLKGSQITSKAWSPADVASGMMSLGRSADNRDSDASATYDEVRIWKGVVPDAQLARSAELGPDLLPVVPAEKKYAAIEVSSGATFSVGANEVATEILQGAGTVAGTGSLAVETLDIASNAIGTLTAEGTLKVKNWMLDVESDATCDKIVGTGVLDASELVVEVRDPSKLGGLYTLAEVGSVVGTPKFARPLKGWQLKVERNRIVLATDGLLIFIR